MSTTVTFMPSFCRFSAISRPMKPPPATTARAQPLSCTYFFRSAASSGVRMVNTPGSVAPSIRGTMALAPVATTQASYSYVSVSPVRRLRAVAVFACGSSFTTSRSQRTCAPVSAA